MRTLKLLFILVTVTLSLPKGAEAQYVQPMRYPHYSITQQANIGVGTVRTTAPSAYLEVGPTSSANKGFLPPRLSTTERDAIASPANGLMIYNKTTNDFQGWNGSAWVNFYIDTAASFITSFYRVGDSVKYIKGGIHYFAFKDSTGGSGSGSVTSIATNNGTGITGGTITTTGTLALDTTNIVETKANAQHKIDSLAATNNLLRIGIWDSTTFVSSLPSNWNAYGFSPSYSNGATFGGNGGSYSSGFIYSEKYTGSLNYTQTIDFTLNTKPSVYNDGIFTGKRSANTAQQTQNAIATKVVDANNFRILINVMYGSTVYAIDSSQSIPMVTGGKYRIYVAGSNTNLYTRIALLNISGKDSITAAVNHKYTKLATALAQPGNTGAMWIGATGSTGNYTVTSAETYNYDIKNPHTLFVGNSIGTRYDASSLQNHYTSLAMLNSNLTWGNSAGGGDRFNELNARVDELIAISPTNIVVEAGVNDNYSDIRSQASQLFDTLLAHNINVYWLKLFNTTSKDTIFYNLCQEKNIKGIDAFRTGLIPETTDGVHLTDDGNQTVAYIIQAEAPEVTGRSGGNELAIQGNIPIEVDLTTINSGTDNRVLFQKSGKLGQSSRLVYDDAAFNLKLNGSLSVGTTSAPVTSVDIVTGGLYIRDFQTPTVGTGLSMGHYSSGYAIIRDLTWPGATYNPIRLGNDELIISGGGKIGIGVTSPTAALNIKAPTSSANTGQIKLVSGTPPTTPETGLINFQNGLLLLDSSNSVRDTIATREWAQSQFYSGTQTPTATNSTNVSASTPGQEQYIKVGNVVTVSGFIQIDCTSASVTSEIDLSLPIPSAFTTTTQLSGVFMEAVSGVASPSHGTISSNDTNDRVTIIFTPRADTNLNYRYTYTYQIL